MMWGWGSGWWIVAGLMMVFCIWMMSRMMSHGGSGHGGGDHGDHDDHGDHAGRGEDAERTLANRLARGEIDTDEYERLLDTLRRTESTTRP